jgi:hypothetical protein
MLDLTTTITINGEDGERFLSSLTRSGRALPAVLEPLAAGDAQSVEVDRRDAAEVARFVDEILDAGWIEVDRPPLLFSPSVGDRVVVEHDTLVELGRQRAGLPPTWFCMLAGMRGTLIGWRDREGDARAIVELDRLSTPRDAREPRLLVFVTVERLVRVSRGRDQRASCGSRSVR